MYSRKVFYINNKKGVEKQGKRQQQKPTIALTLATHPVNQNKNIAKSDNCF